METDEKLDLYFYRTGIVILVLLIGGILYFSLCGTGILYKAPPCFVNYRLGIYCPGCGGTRAVFSLFRGHIVRSFVYHPVVLYGAVVYFWFMLSQTIEKLSRGRLKIGMRFRGIYLYIALGITLINWGVKNFLLLACGIALLG